MLAPDDDVALRVRLTTACAGVDQLLGRFAAAINRRLEHALEQLPGDAAPQAFALMLDIGARVRNGSSAGDQFHGANGSE